ncbi:MAG: ABC transporter family substrate-binding protein [Parascardovia denticolens]
MKKTSTLVKLGALVASAATVFALAACGNNNAGSGSAKSESAAGTPVNYSGTLPMPKKVGVYNNPKSRDQLKDNGSVTYPIVELGPDWNTWSVNGNTLYMKTLWSYYMPVLWTYNVDGSKVTPNKNYVTDYNVKTVAGKQTITLNFNPKAKWNDGTPIDWTAVEAARKVQSGKDQSYTPASTTGWDQVESVKQGTSSKQAVVTMKTPFYPAYSFLDIYPPQAASVNAYTKGWSNNPHDKDWGAGPYIVKSLSSSQVTFKPNPKWWGDKPKMTTVTYKVLEAQAQINAFKNGEIDTVSLSSKDDLKTVASVKGATIRRGYSPTVAVFQMNTTRPQLKDINVRQAIVQAINRKQLDDLANAGIDWSEEVPGSELTYPTQSSYEDNMPKDSGYSVANARKTLEKAGYKMGSDGYYAKNGKTLALSYTTFSDSQKTKANGLAVQKMLKAAGIKLTIDNQPSSNFSTTLTSGNWDIVRMGWSSLTPTDAFSSGYQLYGSDSQSNYTHVGTKEIDEAFKKVPSIKDPKQQVDTMNAAEKKALALYGTFPYYNGPIMGAYAKGLANVGPSGWQTVLRENVGWEK